MDGFEATREVVAHLEALGIDYMIVGGLSSMAYGIPRSTKDADLVLSVDPIRLDELAERLGPEFELDPQGTFELVTGTQRFHLRVPEIVFEIELFLLSKDPHDQSRFSRRQKVFSEQLGGEASIPTPEDVIIMKIRWIAVANRGKDRDDVRDVMAVQGDDALDWDYLHHWTDLHGTRQLLDEIHASIPPID